MAKALQLAIDAGIPHCVPLEGVILDPVTARKLARDAAFGEQLAL
jgi:hypothetical protein